LAAADGAARAADKGWHTSVGKSKKATLFGRLTGLFTLLLQQGLTAPAAATEDRHENAYSSLERTLLPTILG
jgi:hypothetical protein